MKDLFDFLALNRCGDCRGRGGNIDTDGYWHQCKTCKGSGEAPAPPPKTYEICVGCGHADVMHVGGTGSCTFCRNCKGFKT